jgi:hypothetical protein
MHFILLDCSTLFLNVNTLVAILTPACLYTVTKQQQGRSGNSRPED